MGASVRGSGGRAGSTARSLPGPVPGRRCIRMRTLSCTSRDRLRSAAGRPEPGWQRGQNHSTRGSVPSSRGSPISPRSISGTAAAALPSPRAPYTHRSPSRPSIPPVVTRTERSRFRVSRRWARSTRAPRSPAACVGAAGIRAGAGSTAHCGRYCRSRRGCADRAGRGRSVAPARPRDVRRPVRAVPARPPRTGPAGPVQMAHEGALVGGAHQAHLLHVVGDGAGLAPVRVPGCEDDADRVRRAWSGTGVARAQRLPVHVPDPVHHQVGMERERHASCRGRLHTDQQMLAARPHLPHAPAHEIRRRGTGHPQIARGEDRPRERTVQRPALPGDRVALGHQRPPARRRMDFGER